VSRILLESVTKVFSGGVTAVDDVDLTIESGEFMVLVGPSGCGKSTLLRMIAGLEEVTEGTIMIGDRDVTDLAPRARDIAMVFQNYALYPHMSVAKNLGYGLKVRKTPAAEIERRVGEAARLLGLEDLLDRRPAALSGGQRQRVAMGRAIVREPAAFLMDEPLSNLDAKLRVQMRGEISSLQSRLGVTTVYVTHDQVEAMTMGHRVAVLKDGRLQQCATPRELYDRPTNTFVAGFIGSPSMNLIRVPLSPDGHAMLNGKGLQLEERVKAAAAGREVIVGLRPEALEPADDGLAATVELVEELGSDAFARCTADLPGGETTLTVRIDPWKAPQRGGRVSLRPRAGQAHLFDPETGDRLG
jgi:multiple sugar transport system ATP-binding protein